MVGLIAGFIWEKLWTNFWLARKNWNFFHDLQCTSHVPTMSVALGGGGGGRKWDTLPSAPPEGGLQANVPTKYKVSNRF